LWAVGALLACFFAFMPNGSAQTINFEISSLTCDVRVLTDGSITIRYAIEMHYIDGTEPAITEYDVGMPKDGFTINSCTDNVGNPISHQRASPEYCACGETVYQNIPKGQTGLLILEASVPEMVYLDSVNPDRVAIEFIPAWWDAGQVRYLTLRMYIPCSVDSNVYVSTESGYNSPTSKSLSGSTTVISWTKSSLSTAEKYKVAVFFPKSSVTHYVNTKPTNPNLQNTNRDTSSDLDFGTGACASYACCFGFFVIAFIFAMIGTILNKMFGFRRRTYTSPYFAPYGGFARGNIGGFRLGGGSSGFSGGFRGGGGRSCACACAGGGVR